MRAFEEIQAAARRAHLKNLSNLFQMVMKHKLGKRGLKFQEVKNSV